MINPNTPPDKSKIDDDEEAISSNSTFEYPMEDVDICYQPEHTKAKLSVPKAKTVDESGNTSSLNVTCGLKIAIGILLICCGLSVLIDNYSAQILQTNLVVVLEWLVNSPAEGIFVYILVYFLATVFCVPTQSFTMGAGFVFAGIFGVELGVILATCTVFLASSAGAFVSFFASRYLIRNVVEKVRKDLIYIAALDDCFKRNGLYLILMLRFSPALVPSSIVNYVAGATATSFVNFFLSTFGMIPLILLFVSIGATALKSHSQTIDEGKDEALSISIHFVSLVSVIGLVIFVHSFMKKKFEAESNSSRIHPNIRVYNP